MNTWLEKNTWCARTRESWSFQRSSPWDLCIAGVGRLRKARGKRESPVEESVVFSFHKHLCSNEKNWKTNSPLRSEVLLLPSPLHCFHSRTSFRYVRSSWKGWGESGKTLITASFLNLKRSKRKRTENDLTSVSNGSSKSSKSSSSSSEEEGTE